MVEIVVVWKNKNGRYVDLDLKDVATGEHVRVNAVRIDFDELSIEWGEFFARSIPSNLTKYPPRRSPWEQELYDYMLRGELPLSLPSDSRGLWEEDFVERE